MNADNGLVDVAQNGINTVQLEDLGLVPLCLCYITDKGCCPNHFVFLDDRVPVKFIINIVIGLMLNFRKHLSFQCLIYTLLCKFP